MAQGYPSLNLGQAVMVYCYQLAALNRVAPTDGQQLEALHARCESLLHDTEKNL
nr:Dye resistance protein [Candidatus Pantoea persica]